MRITPRLVVLSLLPLLACDGAPAAEGPDAFADDTFADTEFESGETDDGAETDEPAWPEDPADAAPTGGLASELDPEGILNGWSYDSDRDVMVTSPGGLCSGTLLRNDVVLTAKHCVSTDGTINGPSAAASTVQVTQDGPGATLGAVASVNAISRLATEDVAVLQLSTAMSIEGRLAGESTQIYGLPHSTVVGQATLCQGYGLNTCTAGAGVLRAGLMSLESDVNGFFQYDTLGTYNQLQWRGDSGSSCRIPVFEVPQLRKALGVQTTGLCGTEANETGPDRYRDFAIAAMNNWAGNFSDDFSAAGQYEVDEPANIQHGPSAWQVSGGKLRENSNVYGLGGNFEGSRYISSTEVFSDGWISTHISSNDNDSAGLVLRYRDPTHYYRLSYDEQRNFARIVRRNGNAWQVLAEDTNFDIDWSSNPEITFAAVDNMLVGMVNGEWSLVVFDPHFSYTAGRAGVYNWGLQNAEFDDLEIVRF